MAVLGENNVLVEYRGGLAHIIVKSFPERSNVRDLVMPLINLLEGGRPVRVHGVSPCLIPDAYELVVPNQEGVRLPVCNSCALKNQCSGFPKEFLQNNPEPSKPFEPVLREVGIEVNRACLFKCPFCFYQNFYEKEDKAAVPKEKILAIIDEAKCLGAPMVRFFGGDPVLRKDFPGIIEYAKSKGLYTIVNTNALFLDRLSRQRIIAGADSIIVSLQGCDEHSEQILTGKNGMFLPVAATVRQLAKEVPDKLMVSTLISRFLIDNKDRFFMLLSRWGVRSWSLNRPLFTPTEAKAMEWLDMKPHEFRELGSWARIASESSGMSIVMNNLPVCAFNKEDRHVVRHNAQTNSMTRVFYDVRGFFKPGPSMDISLGATMKDAWGNNPYKIVGEGAQVPQECLSCSAYLQCGGGSRTQAWYATGSRSGRDPLMVGAISKGNDEKNHTTIVGEVKGCSLLSDA